MSSDEDEGLFRRLAVELQILEGTAESLQQRLSYLNAAFHEMAYTRLTLEGMEKEQSDASILVPVGGGSFVRAKLEAPDKIIVGMGAGVSIEKTINEAKEIVQNRVSALEKSRLEMQQQLVQVMNKIQEHRTLLNQMMARHQAENKFDVPEA